MTRAEWFVTRGRGHWAKCRKPFLCDFRGPLGPCLNPVAKDDVYLATDLPKYPEYPLSHTKKRYCYHCAVQELTDQRVAQTI